MFKFPMPNDVLGDFPTERKVIASVWYNDDEEQIATVLLLNKAAPYFAVGQQDLNTGALTIMDEHYNIVPAVDSYKDWGGDY